MKAADYWIKRVLRDEAHAQRIAANYAKEYERYIKKAYREVINQLNALQVDILSSGGEVTRSELWQYGHYLQLKKTIEGQALGFGKLQISSVDGAVKQIFEDTLHTTLESLLPKDMAFSLINKTQAATVLNKAWSGESYSSRIWNNTNALAQRIESDMTDMVIKGRGPDELKKALMRDFDTGFNAADTLVRTEASYVYNTSAITGYKESGVQKVEYLVSDSAGVCDICEPCRNKEYPINTAPRLPRHPRCRCLYAPVVDIEAGFAKLRGQMTTH